MNFIPQIITNKQVLTTNLLPEIFFCHKKIKFVVVKPL